MVTIENALGKKEVFNKVFSRLVGNRSLHRRVFVFFVLLGLMVGFFADYAGGEIHLQKSELSAGGWFTKDNLPHIPEKLSIARRLIDTWLEE